MRIYPGAPDDLPRSPWVQRPSATAPQPRIDAQEARSPPLSRAPAALAKHLPTCSQGPSDCPCRPAIVGAARDTTGRGPRPGARTPARIAGWRRPAGRDATVEPPLSVLRIAAILSASGPADKIASLLIRHLPGRLLLPSE